MQSKTHIHTLDSTLSLTAKNTRMHRKLAKSLYKENYKNKTQFINETSLLLAVCSKTLAKLLCTHIINYYMEC